MKKILYLDDSRSALLLVAKMLQDIGEVLPASTASEATKVMTENSIDLFLIDYILGDMHGIEFSKIIRSYPEYAEKPILIVTASYSEQLAYEAMKAGINESFAKPIKNDIFKAAVLSQLEKSYVAEVTPSTISVKCFLWEKCGSFYQYAPQIEQMVRATTAEGASQKMKKLLRSSLKMLLNELEFINEKAAVYHTINVEDEPVQVHEI